MPLGERLPSPSLLGAAESDLPVEAEPGYACESANLHSGKVAVAGKTSHVRQPQLFLFFSERAQKRHEVGFLLVRESDREALVVEIHDIH